MVPPTGVSMSSALTPGGAGGAAARPGPPAPVAATAAAAASSPLVPGGAAGSSVSCGCRPPPRSPRGGVSGGGCFKSNIGGRGGGGGGVSGGGRPASSRGLRASDSIDSLDSGHTSDDSSRSVDSVTSVDVLALGTAKGGLADKVAAAVAGVPVSFPPVGTRPDAPVVAAPVAAEAAAAVTTTTTTVAALPPTASLVAARAALPLRRLNHISFTVQDPEATAAFFEAVLGYTRIVRPRSFDPAGIWLGWGVPPADQWAGQGRYGVALSGLQVHLIAGRPLSRPADVQSDRDHLSFEADDVEAVAACLRDRGISYIDEVFPHEGLRQVRATHPRVSPLRALLYVMVLAWVACARGDDCPPRRHVGVGTPTLPFTLWVRLPGELTDCAVCCVVCLDAICCGCGRVFYAFSLLSSFCVLRALSRICSRLWCHLPVPSKRCAPVRAPLHPILFIHP